MDNNEFWRRVHNGELFNYSTRWTTYSPTEGSTSDVQDVATLAARSLIAKYHDTSLKGVLTGATEDDNKWVKTHSFITDTQYRGYHNDDHNAFKCLYLRLPDEPLQSLYIGVELELEFDRSKVQVYDDPDNERNRINKYLEKFSKITNGMFVYERDSTIENGVELISRPTSYGYWVDPDTVERLAKGFEYLASVGALVKQPHNVGMHVHVRKKFFTSKEDMRDFDWLFSKFQPEIERLGGRKYTDFCNSKTNKVRAQAKIFPYHVDDLVEIQSKITIKRGGSIPMFDHHSAVNETGKTLEVRVFNSTIDYKEFLARIELVRAFAFAARDSHKDGRTLSEILHAVDNKYLNEYVDVVVAKCKENKQRFSLNKKDNGEIKLTVKSRG